MSEFISIKRPPPSSSPLYDAMPASDECHDHCIVLNGDDLTKIGADLPDKGDLVHVSVMGRVVGIGDDHGHRYVRVEVEEIMFVENETTESETGKD